MAFAFLVWWCLPFCFSCAVCGWLLRTFSVFSVVVLCYGLVVLMPNPTSRREATRVDIPIQTDEYSCLLLFYFLPMASQGHSLIFFSTILIKYALSCALRKKI
jgi:hypothetical protein